MATENKPFVGVTHGMRGWFAVLYVWNEEHGGFYEPWNSSDFSYATREGAEKDAKVWAEAEDVEFRA